MPIRNAFAKKPPEIVVPFHETVHVAEDLREMSIEIDASLQRQRAALDLAFAHPAKRVLEIVHRDRAQCVVELVVGVVRHAWA